MQLLRRPSRVTYTVGTGAWAAGPTGPWSRPLCIVSPLSSSPWFGELVTPDEADATLTPLVQERASAPSAPSNPELPHRNHRPPRADAPPQPISAFRPTATQADVRGTTMMLPLLTLLVAAALMAAATWTTTPTLAHVPVPPRPNATTPQQANVVPAPITKSWVWYLDVAPGEQPVYFRFDVSPVKGAPNNVYCSYGRGVVGAAALPGFAPVLCLIAPSALIKPADVDCAYEPLSYTTMRGVGPANCTYPAPPPSKLPRPSGSTVMCIPPMPDAESAVEGFGPSALVTNLGMIQVTNASRGARVNTEYYCAILIPTMPPGIPPNATTSPKFPVTAVLGYVEEFSAWDLFIYPIMALEAHVWEQYSNATLALPGVLTFLASVGVFLLACWAQDWAVPPFTLGEWMFTLSTCTFYATAVDKMVFTGFTAERAEDKDDIGIAVIILFLSIIFSIPMLAAALTLSQANDADVEAASCTSQCCNAGIPARGCCCGLVRPLRFGLWRRIPLLALGLAAQFVFGVGFWFGGFLAGLAAISPDVVLYYTARDRFPTWMFRSGAEGKAKTPLGWGLPAAQSNRAEGHVPLGGDVENGHAPHQPDQGDVARGEAEQLATTKPATSPDGAGHLVAT